MEFLSLISLIYILLSFGSASGFAVISKNITVDLNGGGDFKSISQALNSVPTGNKQWIRIHVKRGIYREKILIPQEKPFILLEGDNMKTTRIQWGDNANSPSQDDMVQINGRLTSRGTWGSSTFIVMADNFVAQDITFENTFAPHPGGPMSQAVAMSVAGDKSAFYRCGFIGVQDTLNDFTGRHYFSNCYIQGFMDFIFGFGQSIYTSCSLKVLGMKGTGAITAQGRPSEKDPSGFVFKYCNVNGEGSVLLGRAWSEYSRVIFFKTSMSRNVVPQGWYAWNTKNEGALTTYVEDSCIGAGADTSKRVRWQKKLNSKEIAFFINEKSYIDQDGWLAQQP